ncbi:MAG: hypothetical protein IRZ09_10755 [Variibacter sp.]|nr:hypothetical protein [Variibacter sp.]
MTRTLTALAAATTFAIVAVAAPTDANAHWRRGGGAVAAGIIGGLAAGAIIGSAMAPRYYYEPAPVYVAPPPPGVCYEQEWVWSPRRGEYVLRNVRVPC